MNLITSQASNKGRNFRALELREYYLYSIWMVILGVWSLFVSGAIFLSLYCLVAAILVTLTPLMFRLPIKFRQLSLKLCGYGQLSVAGLCIVLLLASIPTSPAHAQFLNGAESWLISVMPAVIHPAIILMVNAIRAVFLYYASTKLSEAYRESRGEGTAEFMTLAREPLKGGLIIAIADIVVILFTGTGGGG